MHKKNEAECEKAKLNKISHKIQKTHDVKRFLEKMNGRRNNVKRFENGEKEKKRYRKKVKR